MTDLDEQLGAQLAEGWRPEKGDRVIGKVVARAKGWSDYTNSWYPIITIADEATGNDVALHCFHDVLNKKMKELKPAVGERMGVMYQGEVASKDGRRTINVYDVKVEGRDTDPFADDSPAPIQPQPTQGGEDNAFTDF